MTGMTPRQAAKDAFISGCARRGITAAQVVMGSVPEAGEVWNETAQAAVAASDVQDDFLFERKQVIELRQVLTEMFTCLNTADMSLLDADQVDEWRERAGLED